MKAIVTAFAIATIVNLLIVWQVKANDIDQLILELRSMEQQRWRW